MHSGPLRYLRGNVALIGTPLYFTPVLSTAFFALLLSTALLCILAGAGDGYRWFLIMLEARHPPEIT